MPYIESAKSGALPDEVTHTDENFRNSGINVTTAIAPFGCELGRRGNAVTAVYPWRVVPGPEGMTRVHYTDPKLYGGFEGCKVDSSTRKSMPLATLRGTDTEFLPEGFKYDEDGSIVLDADSTAPQARGFQYLNELAQEHFAASFQTDLPQSTASEWFEKKLSECVTDLRSERQAQIQSQELTASQQAQDQSIRNSEHKMRLARSMARIWGPDPMPRYTDEDLMLGAKLLSIADAAGAISPMWCPESSTAVKVGQYLKTAIPSLDPDNDHLSLVEDTNTFEQVREKVNSAVSTFSVDEDPKISPDKLKEVSDKLTSLMIEADLFGEKGPKKKWFNLLYKTACSKVHPKSSAGVTSRDGSSEAGLGSGSEAEPATQMSGAPTS